MNTGNARWRLPSVGVVGLFFDNQDNVYVNTTTGNPDDIKYSRQIDISRKTEAVLFKLDPKTGKTLWRIKPGGYISYLSGKFIYTIQSYDPNPTDEDVLNDMTASLQKPPYLRIARIRPYGRTHSVGIHTRNARRLTRASTTTPSNSSLKKKCRCCATWRFEKIYCFTIFTSPFAAS